MTIAQTLVDRARATLIDAEKVTWSDDELLGYLNAGISQACGTMMDLYVTEQMAVLVSGVRQALPAGGLLLLDITRNGVGAAVRLANATEFSKTKPDWPNDTASADIKFYFYDRRTPDSFMVYPPATAGATVELVYTAIPAAIALGGTVPISPAFDTALWAYVIAMAYAKNTKRQDLQQTTLFFGLFNQVLDTWKKGTLMMTSEPEPQGVR